MFENVSDNIKGVLERYRRQDAVDNAFHQFLHNVAHPDPNWSVTSPRVLGIHPRLILGEGTDSIACINDPDDLQFVIKVYNRPWRKINEDTLRFYREITSKATQIVAGLDLSLHFSVNPILKIKYWNKGEAYVAISKYIDGVCLSDLLGLSKGLNSQFEPTRRFIPTMQEIIKQLTTAGVTPIMIESMVQDLSDLLNHQLHVRGISLGGVNIKIVLINKNNLQFIITDLAGDISKVISNPDV